MFRMGCILSLCPHDRGQAKVLVPKNDEKFSLRLSYYIYAYLPYVLYNKVLGRYPYTLKLGMLLFPATNSASSGHYLSTLYRLMAALRNAMIKVSLGSLLIIHEN